MKRHRYIGIVAAFVLSVSAAASTQLDLGASTAYGWNGSFCGQKRSAESFGGAVPGRVSLVARPGVVVAGHTPAFRVVNNSTREIAYGEERTRRWVDGRWKEVRWPPGVISGRVPTFVRPNAISECVGPPTWPKWRAGKYQWLLQITRFGVGRGHYLHAIFRLRH